MGIKSPDCELSIPKRKKDWCPILGICLNEFVHHFKLGMVILVFPRVFTKYLAVVAARLRRQGIQVYPYLDNGLIQGISPL